jgi:hypothetical protein
MGKRKVTVDIDDCPCGVSARVDTVRTERVAGVPWAGHEIVESVIIHVDSVDPVARGVLPSIVPVAA